MAMRLKLEDFSTPLNSHPGRTISEEERLSAFEKGYQDGWDDAVAAQNGQEARVTTEFANNLRDLAFTFHEARVHVLNGVRPLLQEMVQKLLPAFAQATLPELVAEQLDGLLQRVADRPVEITVSPASRAALQKILPADPGFPVVVVEEPSLAEGQIYLSAGRSEISVDADSVISEITRLVDDYFNPEQRKQAHG